MIRKINRVLVALRTIIRTAWDSISPISVHSIRGIVRLLFSLSRILLRLVEFSAITIGPWALEAFTTFALWLVVCACCTIFRSHPPTPILQPEKIPDPARFQHHLLHVLEYLFVSACYGICLSRLFWAVSSMIVIISWSWNISPAAHL
ncbi:hypothetical protein DFH07DRAFT_184730 [Mycena maculata]|uniref:Uncharacterized protein n=1 Tax=Mycena maculata TaxID=230809 RepID=A0AAD7HVG6_9AGAR|nr:hypothetical protein DFH07DRAFT_184730 [Mycena maculata]